MTQKFTLSNRPSRMYLICRKLFEGFSKPLLPLSVPKVHGTRYYGSLILGRVLERISPAKSWFREEKASFQNRSFLGLTTLSVKICTDATHRRKSISSLQHPLSRVCYDGVAHGQGG